MIRWHETLAAQMGLRIGGLAVLTLAAMTVRVLYTRVHAHPPAPAGLADLGLCAIVVVLMVVGDALLFAGPALWKQVMVPGRWSATA